MQKVLTAEQMREVDRLTTEQYGIPSILLMENAAHAVARVITEKLGGSVAGKSVLVLCGKGNNGGDGAALARILQLSGADVELVVLGRIEETKGDARTNFITSNLIVGIVNEIENEEDWNRWFLQGCKQWNVVVDAIFGTGLSRPLEGWLESAARQILLDNVSGRDENGRLAIAIDIPTGLNSDLADPIGEVLESDVTVTFTAPKPANVLAPSSSLGGEVIVADIGSPFELIDQTGSELYLATDRDAMSWLAGSGFTYDSYKNRRGHVLVIAGSESYSGAAVLAGNAAMRSGVGLVTIVTPGSLRDSIAARVLPEVMVRGVAETDDGAISEAAFDEIADLLKKADAVAIGCGLSQNESTGKFVHKVVDGRRQPMVVDADALNLLSPFVGGGRSGFPLILTPHEGEFMRLLGTTDKNAIRDRVAAVREFATGNNVILVLKGERVLIGEPGGKVVVNPTGNSGLGKAGTGDTLTGILAGSVAQAAALKINIFETVVAAVYISGMAGDIAERKYGKRVMTASDVRECLTEAFAVLAGEG